MRLFSDHPTGVHSYANVDCRRVPHGRLLHGEEHSSAGGGVESLDGVPQPGARHGDPERAARRANQFLGQRSLPGAVHARLSGASGNERPGPARGHLRDLARRSVIARVHSKSSEFRTNAPSRLRIDAMTVSRGREFLSIPGPTNIPDAVLAAMHRPAIDIYTG